ncbi:hypothetical protein COLO4_20631 [Corchorus olitorius]|uniref:Uncharacterized protein n=1 Tax=Corchorus olitorius TaxID=93759 RepID=A0A1R3IYJ0_9ROSI|nr:hypothetical protein COLO4_20631 [Corchorus olitorius]
MVAVSSVKGRMESVERRVSGSIFLGEPSVCITVVVSKNLKRVVVSKNLKRVSRASGCCVLVRENQYGGRSVM